MRRRSGQFGLRLLAVALLIGAPLSSRAQSGTSPEPTAAPSPAAIVHAENFAYDPAELDIHVGDTVEFINDDPVGHTITADDTSFDSGNLDQHQTWTHTFTAAGTYTYFCTYHPFMKAKIVVSTSGTPPAQPT